MQEYQSRFEQLNQSIEPSDELILQTRQRMAEAKPQKWLPRMKKTVAVAVCTMLIFTGAVNVSPAFASAAAKVPIVRELVLAVAFDPSMKAAIEHNYVQLVKQSASDNGYQIDVEYLVADPGNLTVYYKMDEITEMNSEADLESSTGLYEEYQFEFDLLRMNGEELKATATWDYPISDEEKEALNKAQFYFTGEEKLPEQMLLRLIVKKALPLSEGEQKQLEESMVVSSDEMDSVIAHFEAARPEYEEVARMTLPIYVDKDDLFNVRTLEINQMVNLDGQKVIFDKVEIYPTQVRVFWHPDEANTHHINGMQVSLQSRKRGNWKAISNGVTGIGTMGKPQQLWLDSSWFGDGKEYQLSIERYGLLPKEKKTVTYDYATNTFTNLPEYVRLERVQPCDTGLFMEFVFCNNEEKINGHVLQHDSVTQVGSGQSYDEKYRRDEEKGIYWFYNSFIVEGDAYKHGPITFDVTWAPSKILEELIIVPLDVDEAE